MTIIGMIVLQWRATYMYYMNYSKDYRHDRNVDGMIGLIRRWSVSLRRGLSLKLMLKMSLKLPWLLYRLPGIYFEADRNSKAGVQAHMYTTHVKIAWRSSWTKVPLPISEGSLWPASHSAFITQDLPSNPILCIGCVYRLWGYNLIENPSTRCKV